MAINFSNIGGEGNGEGVPASARPPRVQAPPVRDLADKQRQQYD